MNPIPDSPAEDVWINPEDQVLMVAAHPDDEIIGAGAQLPLWNGRVSIVHVTDGAPRNPSDALASGHSTRQAYAKARQRELRSALELIQDARFTLGTPASVLDTIPQIQLIELGYVDQEASFHLVELVCALATLLVRLQPRFVVTHPYEGGRPDHDSAAFAANAACSTLRSMSGWSPNLIEMTSYHDQFGRMVCGEFLPWPGHDVMRFHLSSAQCEFKRRLFNCFMSQRKVLQSFKVDCESFRRAPDYDFTKPPHSGTLHYERFPWGVTGQDWRVLATAALLEIKTYARPPSDHVPV